jgi:hypothetical protein
LAVTAAATSLPTVSAAAEINYLPTVLFNFKDGVSPAKPDEVLAETGITPPAKSRAPFNRWAMPIAVG